MSSDKDRALPSLSELYRQLVAFTDPFLYAVRAAESMRQHGKQLEEMALMSGAIPGEFQVVIAFQGRGGNSGFRARLS